jgi:nucleotide-binding universal stress UspA family protein
MPAGAAAPTLTIEHKGDNVTEPTSARAIVVGHDGSALADRALQVAAEHAERFNAPLIVVRAWRIDADIPGYGRIRPDDRPFPQLADAVRSSLAEDCRTILKDHPGLEVRYRAEPGAPADVLCQVSETARVLVVGSRGLGGLGGLLLGSVTARCLHQASCPVLIIRENRAPSTPKTSDEEQRMLERLQPGSILVGHDGSVHSAHALQIAAEFAEALDVPVTAVRCWSIDSMPHGLLWRDGYVVPVTEASDSVRTQLQADIAGIATRHPDVEFHCEGIFGEPGETLVRLSPHASLLVTGRRGRGGFRSLLLGSVASHCAHRAMCPTLVVPHERGGITTAAYDGAARQSETVPQ